MRKLTTNPSKWNMAFKSIGALLPVGALALGLVFSFNAAAVGPSTELVRETDVTRQAEDTPPLDKWVLYTRAGTSPTAAVFRNGPATPPSGSGSLELTTVTGAEKAFLFNFDHIGTKLSDVGEISYNTFRTAGSLQQVAALNVVVDYNGPSVAGGFSTLVFEPVYNTDQGPIVSGQWQDWTATGSGVWWSTKPINGQCEFTCYKTWAEIVASNPDATVLGGVGINQGSGNAGLTTAVDAFTFDETTYNFELVAPKPVTASSKDQCKDGGWTNFETSSNVRTYKNQGQCVADVSSSGNSKMHRQ
jgi:hypothetical protein